MSLTRARQEFLRFIDEHEEDLDIHYRIDTWQMWPTCPVGEGDHNPEEGFPCYNPGLTLELEDSMPDFPFVVSLGPWILWRGHTIGRAWQEIPKIGRMIQYHSLHLHKLHVPCHTGCVLCEQEEATVEED
jgi:hypothetical protein